MFVKMLLRERLVCFPFFVELILLALSFLLPLPFCFLIYSLPTVFAAVLKLLLPLTTSATSGAANSNKSAPTRFGIAKIYLRKDGVAIFPLLCASAPKPRPRFTPIPLRNGMSTCHKATFFKRLLG